MSFEFGDIVLVPFPFTDQTTTKKRPAVVVSSSEYQHQRPDVVLMAVTSQVQLSPSYGELVITEWEKAGLVKPSVIKPVLATIHNLRFYLDFMAELRQALRFGSLAEVERGVLRVAGGRPSAPTAQTETIRTDSEPSARRRLEPPCSLP